MPNYSMNDWLSAAFEVLDRLGLTTALYAFVLLGIAVAAFRLITRGRE